jgi:hypothetical protein
MDICIYLQVYNLLDMLHIIYVYIYGYIYMDMYNIYV